MMSKKFSIVIAAVFFIAGLVSAVMLRLHHSGMDHSQHGSSEPSINLQQLPLRTLSNDTTTLATLQQPKVLVNFWASWCAPCLREMPLLQAAQSIHNVPTVGISYETIEEIQQFVDRHPVDYPLYKSSFDVFYFMQEAGNRTAVLPYTVLVDNNGKILNTKIGDFENVNDIIEFASNKP